MIYHLLFHISRVRTFTRKIACIKYWLLAIRWNSEFEEGSSLMRWTWNSFLRLSWKIGKLQLKQSNTFNRLKCNKAQMKATNHFRRSMHKKHAEFKIVWCTCRYSSNLKTHSCFIMIGNTGRTYNTNTHLHNLGRDFQFKKSTKRIPTTENVSSTPVSTVNIEESNVALIYCFDNNNTCGDSE